MMEILSLLTLKDLRAMKDCCRRFKYLVDSVVQKRFQKDEYFQISNCIDIKDAAMTLIKFGRSPVPLTTNDVLGYIQILQPLNQSQ